MADQSDTQRRVFEEEALRIVQSAAQEGLTLRLLGSLAFQIHSPQWGHLQKLMGRAYTDLDYAGYSPEAARMEPFFSALGYRGDPEVNLYFAGQRMIFQRPENGLHVDVFFDKLNFCHQINWVGRLEVDTPTLPLAEMLLEKMQIVKIGEKDIIDTIMLLLEHELGTHDHDVINVAHISELCAQDWGLWRTTSMNLGKVALLSQEYDALSAGEKTRVVAQVQAILERLDRQPKSTAWKIRSKVGDRVKWYQDVEETP
jgi:hypothetical protein